MRRSRFSVRPAGWFRQNRLALAAVAVLLPATLWVTFATQWYGYYDGRPSRPVDVAAGESVEFGYAGWQVESTDRFTASSAEGRERDLPPGTDLVIVAVRVDPGNVPVDEDDRLCSARLEEAGTSGRSWGNVASTPITLDGATPEFGSCSAGQDSPYTLEAEFIVPADAGQNSALALSIVLATELPEYARFALD